jgi:hypothetical protein
MKLYLRVHYGWLPKDSDGVVELDNAIEDVLVPFGFHITDINLDSGLRDLLFVADELVITANTQKRPPQRLIEQRSIKTNSRGSAENQ